MSEMTPATGRGAALSTGAHLVALIALCVLAVVVPILTLLFSPSRSAIPFVASLILFGCVAVWLGLVAWSWRRPQWRAGARDVVLAVVPLVSAGVGLVLIREVAYGMGIRGSALPRVRSGAGYAADYAYLAATGVVVVVVVLAAVLLLLHLRSLPRVRALSQRVETTSEQTVGAVGAALAVPAEPRVTRAVTSADDPFWRRLMSPGAWVLFGVCAVLSLPGLWIVAADYDNRLGVLGFPFFFMAAPVTAWACLESVWRRDREYGVMVPSVLRSILVAGVTALPIGALDLLFLQLPVVTERVRSFQRPDEVYEGHYWFPLEGQSLLASVGWDLTLGGVAMALVAGIFTAVFVVLPVTAFRDPDQFIREQGLSRAPEHRARNAAVVRVLALGLPLAFVVPALLLNSNPDDLRRWVGIALAVVGVLAALYVWFNQRVDFEARAASGQPMGVLNPEDRERRERELRERELDESSS